ncbi:MAG: amidohydrolase family protein [Pyrinomonadaceae bacterium]|nr:amidohydrolase family protein [Pyrinomonadaceae bacterium]
MNSRFNIQSSRLYRFMFVLLASQMMLIPIAAQNGPTQQNLTGTPGTFAITNARIVTVSGATIPNGTIVISDGKIASVGANVSVPGGATRIDGTGLSVYPGMIDAGTNMGLQEIGNAVIGTVDVAETGNFNPNAKAILGLNPHTSHINVTRVNGITMAHSMPRGSLIAGQSAIVNLNGSSQDEMTVVPTFGLVISFPRISTFAGFNPRTGPRRIDFSQAVKRRDTRVKNLKDIFERAKRYASVKAAAAKDNSLPTPKTNLKMEAMIPYVGGEKPIVFSAERARDIRGVIKFVEEMKLKAIIYGGAEAWKEVDGLKKNNIPVIYNRIHSNPSNRDDPYDANFESPSKLQKAGVRFCISTGNNGANVRELPYQAGLASAYGLSKDDALKSVTLYPAQILGVDKMVGSIEVGKVANIVVTDGDILEVRTRIKHMFITGRKIPLTSRHTEFFEAFKDRKLKSK